MPGVLITEACLQTSAFMGPTNEEYRRAPDASNVRFFCVGFNMKFVDSVQSGDHLRIDVRLVRRVGQMFRVRAAFPTKLNLSLLAI